FHEGPAEWTLDLMRAVPGAPDGTMHALIARAAEEAAAAGSARVSLPALPLPRRRGGAGVTAAVARPRRPDGTALARVKAALAPRAETLCSPAPSRSAPAPAALDLLRAVPPPPPLPAEGGPAHDPGRAGGAPAAPGRHDRGAGPQAVL